MGLLLSEAQGKASPNSLGLPCSRVGLREGKEEGRSRLGSPTQPFPLPLPGGGAGSERTKAGGAGLRPG